MGEYLVGFARLICGLIDFVAYKVLSSLYNLFTEISQLSLYSEDIMQTLNQRIFLILGIFMLFRVAISLINYLISPDKINDSAKGGKKLITNIIVSLVLLSTVNIIFKEAYIVQQKLIETRIIEKIFFGAKGNNNNNISMGYILYYAFIEPNDKVVKGCETLFDEFAPMTDECSISLRNANLSTSLTKGINTITQNHDFSNVLHTYDLLNYKSNGEYFFKYTPIISTAAAVIVILMMLSFTIDLAIRIVKLLFLQIISPIPIVSNMDPGKGAEIFKNWYKQCINTYISVFLRITAVNFAIFMIILIKTNFANIFTGKSTFLTILLIIGCLMFAKQVPKLIEEIFGIKSDGMLLNPLKKFNENAGLASVALAGGAALGANALLRTKETFGNLGGTVSALAHGNFGAAGRNFGKTIGSAFYGVGSTVAGGISGSARGLLNAGKGQTFSQSYLGAYRDSIKARNNRDSRHSLGILAPSVWVNKGQRHLGMDTTAESQDADVKVYDEFTSSADEAVSISESEVQKYANKIELGRGRVGASAHGFTTLGELREAINDTTHYTAQERAAFNMEYEDLKGQAESAYRDYATEGSLGLHRSTEFSFINADDVNGETAKTHITNVNEIFEKNKGKSVFVKNKITEVKGSNIKDVNKKVKLESKRIKNSDKFRKAHKIQEQTNREKQ